MPAMQSVESVMTGPKFHASADTENSLPSNMNVGVVSLMLLHGTTGRRMKRFYIEIGR